MSKPNKVNKSNYVQAGRLTPDDMAREREKIRDAEKAPKATAARGEREASRRRTGRE
jgi:hypothetical protein